VTATPNVHSEPISRSSVRAGTPTPFRRCPCWASRWAMRAYQVCPSPLVGGPVDQPLQPGHHPAPKPGQLGIAAPGGSDAPGRSADHGASVWYTPYPSLTKIPAWPSTRASNAALLQLTCTGEPQRTLSRRTPCPFARGDCRFHSQEGGGHTGHQIQGACADRARPVTGVRSSIHQDTGAILLVSIHALRANIAVQVSQRQVTPYAHAAGKLASSKGSEA
jgi:hypothetical protein